MNKLSVLEYVIGPRNNTPHNRAGWGGNYSIMASSILDYVGLHDYSAKVVFIGGIKGGGYIDLREGKNFTIYVSQAVNYGMYGPKDEPVFAVISHEICHKLLHNRRFSVSNERENEIYTDLAAIYVGLGIYILNGCSSVEIRMDGNRMTSQSQRVGYMSRSAYAYAYALTNTLYGLSRSQYTKGLSFLSKISVWRRITPRLDRERYFQRMTLRTKKYRHYLLLAEEMKNVFALKNSKKAIKEKLRKFEYVNDVVDSTTFTKPITAYSLYREPVPVSALLKIRMSYFIYKSFLHKVIR